MKDIYYKNKSRRPTRVSDTIKKLSNQQEKEITACKDVGEILSTTASIQKCQLTSRSGSAHRYGKDTNKDNEASIRFAKSS